MHCFVPENGRCNPGKLSIAEHWNGAEIGADSAFFEPGGELKDIVFGFEFPNREFVILSGFHRYSAELSDGGSESGSVFFMMALKLNGQIERRLSQQTAFSAQLVRSNWRPVRRFPPWPRDLPRGFHARRATQSPPRITSVVRHGPVRLDG